MVSEDGLAALERRKKHFSAHVRTRLDNFMGRSMVSLTVTTNGSQNVTHCFLVGEWREIIALVTPEVEINWAAVKVPEDHVCKTCDHARWEYTEKGNLRRTAPGRCLYPFPSTPMPVSTDDRWPPRVNYVWRDRKDPCPCWRREGSIRASVDPAA